MTGPWDDGLFDLAGHSLTLNDIEHRILRPLWRDHRIHFAVNCASLGCPDLSPQAYTAATLEQQLAAAESKFLGHPRAVSFNDAGRLRLSSLFDWYLQDFATDREQLLRYLTLQRTDLAPALKKYQGRIDYHYDWQLNARSTN